MLMYLSAIGSKYINTGAWIWYLGSEGNTGTIKWDMTIEDCSLVNQIKL